MPGTLDLVELVRRLREAGFRTDTRQYLIANELLLALARQGTLLTDEADPRNGERLVSHFGPIFCTSPEEQTRFRDIVRDWLGVSLPAAAVRSPVAAGFWPSARRIVGLIAGPLAAAALLVGLLAAPLWYLFATIEVRGEVVRATMLIDGNARTAPAPEARLVHRGHVIPVAPDGRFSLPIRRHAPPSQLIASVEGERIVVDIDPRTSRKITIRFEAPVHDSAVPPPRQRYVLGAARILNPPQDAPRIAERRDWRSIVAVAAAVGAAVFAAMALAAWRRRQLVLRRMPVEGRADLRTLAMERAALPPLPGPWLRGLVRGLRRPRLDEVRDLDVALSVAATVNAAGLFTPVQVPRRRTPEYLVLSSRHGADDHQAHLVDALLTQLGPAGVSIEHYTFDDDPRICRRADDPLRRYALGELAATHHAFTLWIVAESRSLLDPLSGEPAPWTNTLTEWSNRVLFTPAAPAHWTQSEWSLAATGLAVLPWSTAGIRTYADLTGEWRMERLFPAPYARAFPALLALEGREWLSPATPEPETLVKLLRQLRGYLGPDGFAWLCACAIYPQLSMPLTLNLGAAVSGARSTEALIDEVLPALARLPWFRHGAMPDWLRLALIAQLASGTEGALRAQLGDLLGRLATHAPPGPARMPAQGLRIATPVDARDIVATEPPNSRLRDAVFLGFMTHANLDKLAVQAPAALRNLLRASPPRVPGVPPAERRSGWSRVIGHWRWFATFRPELVRALASLGVAAAALGVAAVLLTAPEPEALAPTRIRALAVSSDAAMLAIANDRGSAWLWSTGADKPLQTLVFGEPVESIAVRSQEAAVTVSPPKNLAPETEDLAYRRNVVAAGGTGGTVFLWDDPASPNGARSLKGHTARVTDVAFSPDGERLASAAEDGTARIWDVATGVQRVQLTGHDGAVRTVEFSAAGTRIVTTSDDLTARVWDAATGRPIARIDMLRERFLEAAFSTDGRLIVTVAVDGVLRRWDANTGKLQGAAVQGAGPPARVALGPNRDVMAAALGDGSIRLTDVRAGRVLEPPIALPGEIAGLAFTTDGQFIAATAETVRIWPFALKAPSTVKAPSTTKASVPAASKEPPARMVAVPNIVGLGLSDALKRLEAIGLTGRQTDPAGTIPFMIVIEQRPRAGQRVAPGSTVAFRTDRKEVSVPNVIGMSLDRARKELERVNLGVSAPRAAPGSARVVDQRPAEASILGAGGVVTLQVDLPAEAGNAPPQSAPSTGWCCVLQSGFGAQQQQQRQQQQVQRTAGGDVIEMDEKQCAGVGGRFWQQQSDAIAACRPPGAPAAPAAPSNLRVQ